MGVKYTNCDSLRILADDAPDMLWGAMKMIMAGSVVSGPSAAVIFCRGHISSSNEAHAAGDMDTARKWQARSWKMIETIAAHGYMHSAKAVMGMVGVNCGPAAPLPRLLMRTGKNSGELEAMGFLIGS